MDSLDQAETVDYDYFVKWSIAKKSSFSAKKKMVDQKASLGKARLFSHVSKQFGSQQ